MNHGWSLQKAAKLGVTAGATAAGGPVAGAVAGGGSMLGGYLVKTK